MCVLINPSVSVPCQSMLEKQTRFALVQPTPRRPHARVSIPGATPYNQQKPVECFFSLYTSSCTLQLTQFCTVALMQ